MKRALLKLLSVGVAAGILFNLFGCAALKKKFTRKTKEKPKAQTFYQVGKYDIEPSMELYEKHYIFWVNWHGKLIDEIGRNFKSDMRCIQEVIGNLQDMAALLVDEKAVSLLPHIDSLRAAKLIIDKRDMTKANQTRIRRILEREHRIIKREFSPRGMVGHIREEWK